MPLEAAQEEGGDEIDENAVQEVNGDVNIMGALDIELAKVIVEGKGCGGKCPMPSRVPVFSLKEDLDVLKAPDVRIIHDAVSVIEVKRVVNGV